MLGPDVLGLALSRANSLASATLLLERALTTRRSRAFLTTFANPQSVGLLKADRRYREALNRMDAVFCDGIALAVAAGWCRGARVQRISFDSTSLAPWVFAFARDRRMRIALVGGRPGIAETAARQIEDVYPGIRVVGAFDGYAPEHALKREVMTVDPEIVICGMGAPRQEAFLVALSSSGWSGIGFTCGGYFDHLGERFNFYPALVDKLNLRWLYRLAREPRRIGYRCIVEYAPFWHALMKAGLCTLARGPFGTASRVEGRSSSADLEASTQTA